MWSVPCCHPLGIPTLFVYQSNEEKTPLFCQDFTNYVRIGFHSSYEWVNPYAGGGYVPVQNDAKKLKNN